MAAFLVFLLVVGGLVLRGMSAEQRVEFYQQALVWLTRVRAAITYIPPSCQPFNDALRARTRWTIVTPAIVLANVVIFIGMLFGAGAFSDRDTLLAWGASVGPRTTNGEWWRLLGSMFVHAGLIHMLASVAGTLRAGLVLERFVGPVAFATTYLAAGVLASLASVAAHPVALHYGASGAIFGVYGLLVAALVWSMLRSSELAIPVAVLKQLGPGAAFFLLYTFVTEGLISPSMIVGLGVGGICGLVLASGVGERKPPHRRVLATMSATFGIVIVLAVPLRGVADVSGEIAQVVAIEDQTSHEYDALVDKFKRGRTTTDGLIQQIERIRPSLHAVSVRLNSLDKIPPEHQWMMSAAKQYLQLRDDSWRLRAEGLRTSNMKTLQKADGAERASLEALDTIRPMEHD